MIGREGMTGLAVVLGADQSPNDTYIQNAGQGLRMPADKLAGAMQKSKSLRYSLLLDAHAFFIQATQTAKANGRGKIEGDWHDGYSWLMTASRKTTWSLPMNFYRSCLECVVPALLWL